MAAPQHSSGAQSQVIVTRCARSPVTRDATDPRMCAKSAVEPSAPANALMESYFVVIVVVDVVTSPVLIFY